MGYEGGARDMLPPPPHPPGDLFLTGKQGWAKLVLIALERYSVALKRLTFNLR